MLAWSMGWDAEETIADAQAWVDEKRDECHLCEAEVQHLLDNMPPDLTPEEEIIRLHNTLREMHHLYH